MGLFSSSKRDVPAAYSPPASSQSHLVGIPADIKFEPLVKRALVDGMMCCNQAQDNSEERHLLPSSKRRPPISSINMLHPNDVAKDTHGSIYSTSGDHPKCFHPTKSMFEKPRETLRSKMRRSAGRKAKAEALLLSPFRYHLQQGRLLNAAELPFTKIGISADALPSKAGCWVGKNIPPIQTEEWGVEECLAYGIRVVDWDGRTPHAFIDAQGRIIVILAGRPDDPSWDSAIADANATMILARQHGDDCGAFTAADLHHRCGHFAAMACGISYGGGQREPGNLAQSSGRRSILNSLLNNKNIQRVAGFQSNAFAYYAPKLYKNYAENLQPLYERSSNLDINFSNSIFPACTFNLGPNTVTLDHTDPGNVAYGMCAVTALGDYNPDCGGHLILFDLNLMIRFPPGSTILLPSSVLRHGNTPIQDGECRMSMTQYCAGGLFRWVKYGFRTAEALLALSGGRDMKSKIDGNKEERTLEAMNLFSKLSEIVEDRKILAQMPIPFVDVTACH